jgi:formaldehyde dismutase / methanol dehydrogenase
VINKNMLQFPINYGNTWAMGKIAFGWGAHETVADECKQAGIKKALVVTTGLEGTGIVEEIIGILKYNGIDTEIFDKITSNPKDHEVEAGLKVFLASGCNGVVSIGGGSSHDCGKGIRALLANRDTYICDMVAQIDPPWMETMKKFKPVTIPQITINTTTGTGAESTGCAAITNTRIKAKQLVVIPGIAPATAIIDPLMARTMPQHLAAQTGFDGYTHAFESYIARVRTPYSAYLSLGAIEYIMKNLREFSYNRMNHTACEAICWASSMAALSLSMGAGVGLVHGLGHGISVLHGTHHGLANAVITIPMERYNQGVYPDKFAEMVKFMGVDTRNMTKMEASDRWFDETERLLKDLGIQTGNLNKQFGMTKEDCAHIIKFQYSNDYAREGNPRDYNYDQILELFTSCL